MNKVFLLGRLTRDPESRMTQNSVELARFSLACQNDYTSRDGEKTTEFINCVAFGNIASTILRYCHKGMMISAQGRIRNNSYDAQDGTKRYSTDIVIDSFEFTGSRGDNTGSNSYNNASYNTSNSSAYSPSSESTVQETADISEDPYKEFGDEYTLSSDDLPF